MTALAFVGLAIAGTLTRALAVLHGNRTTAGTWLDGFPLGTFAVNTVGSFALGLLASSSPDVVTVVGRAGSGRSRPSRRWPTSRSRCTPRVEPGGPAATWPSRSRSGSWPPLPASSWETDPVTDIEPVELKVWSDFL